MNTRFTGTPEIITTCKMYDEDGGDTRIGDKVTGIHVIANGNHPEGLVTIDVREFRGRNNLSIEVELPELMAALSRATIEADRD